MGVKIHELAKELDMPSKDVLTKANSMGIEAKSHMSVISDMDAVAVKNSIIRGKAGVETKIVKVATKKTKPEKQKEDEPRVVVKAAVKPMTNKPKPRPASGGRPQAENKPVQKSPQGIPRRVVDPSQMEVVRIPADKLEEAAQPIRIDRETLQKEQEQKKVQEAGTDGTGAGAETPKEKAAMPDAAQKSPISPQRQASEPVRNTPPQKQPAGDRRNRTTPPAAGQPGGTEKPRSQGRDSRASGRPPERENASGGTGQGERKDRPERTGRDGSQRKDGRPASGGNQGQNRQAGSGNRPQSSGAGNNRPQGSGGNRPAAAGGQGRGNSPGKPGQKPGKPGAAKGDAGKKNPHTKKKEPYQPRNLEKRPVRTKRPRSQPKPAPAEDAINMEELAPGTKIINVPITVAGFAEQVEKSTSEVIMTLMRMGIMANINQNIDEDTVEVLGEELNVPIKVGKVAEEQVEEGLELFEDKPEDLKPRPPIITVMGHVDHGKTSLLDAIRKTNVTEGEAGGITQHIGASEVTVNGERIVFLDTPGHEAFTAMRARGAHVTDIAVLVVAADDSVKPQTIESISHAKAAGVPIIVAINKIDKPGANLDKVKQDLADHGILVEEWGGQTISVPVSARTGEGIVTLLEMILLQAEVLELKANPGRLAMGTVIEARLDKARGPVATLLVLNGTLESGMSVVAGTSSGRIRAMMDFQGHAIKEAGPATAVEILGLTEVPQAGDEFHAVREDRIAREIAENRRIKLREEVMVKNASTSLEKLFSQIQEGEIRELNLIIKGDVQGSVGALVTSLEKLKNENVQVKIVHTGVGTVTESDVMLASTADAVIIAFNVRPSTAVTSLAEREEVEIRTYRVIYDVIDDVEAAMKGMLDPVFREVVMGKAEVRNTFKVPGVGMIAGSYITEGKVQRNAEVRLVRDGIVIHEGKISSLKRFKDDVREVAQGYECGIGLESYNDLKESDVIEAFKMEEIQRD